MEDTSAPIGPHKSDDFYSKAFDFYSFIMGEVDPRSGMYSARVTFVSGEGNRLRGPHFEFKLSYSPLDDVDFGFGKGWRLAISEFESDPTGGDDNILRLSAGDSQKLKLRPAGTPCEFPDLKLKAHRFILQRDGSATIEYLTGPIEHLEPRRGTSRPLLTTHITNPCGDSVHLQWTTDHNGNTALASVKDDEGNDLLRIEYRTANLAVLSIPTAPNEVLEVHFQQQGRLLRSISVPALNALNMYDVSPYDVASWQFQYRPLLGLNFLEAIDTPEGVREQVVYAQNALIMPAGASPAFMPAVSSRKRVHIQNPLAFIDESRYTYTNNGQANMYGYPLIRTWQPRNDQLLHHGDATYHWYGSTETQYDAQGKPSAEVVRSFNNFHLAILEKTTRGTFVQSVETEYGIRPGITFGNQPDTFQLPTKVTQSLWNTSSPSVIQKTITTHSYDNMGNVVTTFNDATNVTETHTYYPPEGDGMNCPPDPMGMVYRLKSKTVSPKTGDDSPIVTTSYRYIELPLRGDIPRQPEWIQPIARTYYVQSQSENTVSQKGTPLSFSSQSFYTDNGSWHGTVQEEETSQQDSIKDEPQRIKRQYAYSVDKDTIVTTTRETTHDGIVNEIAEAKSLVSGLVLWTVDALGNQTDYAYDAIGRVIRETYCPGIPDYETTSTQSYQISNGERLAVRTGITGLPHAVWMDPLGRVVREDEPLPLTEGVPPFAQRLETATHTRGRWSQGWAIKKLLADTTMTVRSLEYDHFGQVTKETLSDRLDNGRQLQTTTVYAYDDLGQPTRVTAADGTHTVITRELVKIATDDVVLRTRQWRESAQGQQRSDWTSVDTDRAGLKRSVTVGRWEGLSPHAEAAGEWHYDHAGRCISQIDAMGQETRQTWDERNRPMLKTLPNGDTIRLTYAPGLAGELPSNIEVAAKSGAYRNLGKRSYDGLNRLIEETAGSLKTELSYEKKQLSPRTVNLPGGGVITNTYDARLGEVLLEQREATIASPLKSAAYDKHIGLPTSVSADQKRMTIRTDYLGRMTEQDLVFDNENTRSAKVDVSLQGLELRKVSVDSGVRSFEYDDVGRLVGMLDIFANGSQEDAIITKFGFDALSRMAYRRCEESNSGRRVEEYIDYDEMGRPATTTWVSFDGKTTSSRKLTLTFRADNKIESKSWYEGNESNEDTLIRKESMEYDPRGRLVIHSIPSARGQNDYPRDEGGGAYRGIGLGNAYERQEFTYDEIDNILSVETTLTDGKKNTTKYTYDAVDIDRLVRVENSMLGYPGEGNPIALEYDANGNMTSDGIGTTLAWDSASRLASVRLADGTLIHYEYGPDGRVAKVSKNQGTPSYRYYEDGNLRLEAGTNDRTFLRTGRFVMAESVLSKDPLSEAIRETFLLEYDGQGSVHAVLGNGPDPRDQNSKHSKTKK